MHDAEEGLIITSARGRADIAWSSGGVAKWSTTSGEEAEIKLFFWHLICWKDGGVAEWR